MKISKTPGATRSVNYFSFGKFAGDKIGMIRGAADSAEFAMLNKPEMYLVDLPGYGFAKSSRSDQAQVSLAFKWLYLYTVNILFHVELCIRKL